VAGSEGATTAKAFRALGGGWFLGFGYLRRAFCASLSARHCCLCSQVGATSGTWYDLPCAVSAGHLPFWNSVLFRGRFRRPSLSESVSWRQRSSVRPERGIRANPTHLNLINLIYAALCAFSFPMGFGRDNFDAVFKSTLTYADVLS